MNDIYEVLLLETPYEEQFLYKNDASSYSWSKILKQFPSISCGQEQ